MDVPGTVVLGVEVLGPVRVRLGDRSTELPGLIPPAALALLALHAGQALPATALVHALWGASAPPSAATTLPAHLSRLRRRGVGPALVHRDGGYVLDISPDHVDAHRAEHLRRQAMAELDHDPATALVLLQEAAALWRGPALQGLDRVPYAPAEQRRLRALRRSIDEGRFEAMLRLGRGAEAVAELEALAASHPTDERVLELELRALSAAGRREEALRTHRAFTRHMRDSLGIEPSRRVDAIHRAILRGDLDPTSSRSAASSVRATGSAGVAATPTPFTGRREELARLRDLSDHHGVVTVAGVSGMGKSRLVQQHLETSATLVDGPWVVDCAALDSPTRVVAAVADAIGLAQRDPDAATIAAAIRARRTWLVLDACEAVVDGVAAILDVLLPACPHLTVYVTCLGPLGRADEVVLAVGPLDASHVDGDAVRLFVAAAGRWPGVPTPGGSALPTVQRICRELDGMPLAIELAAAHTRTLGLEEVLALLDDRLRLLGHGGAAARAHQRTLRAAISWTVDGLDPTAREALEGAATFVGGFTRAALVGLLGGDGGPEAASRGLLQLQERSLVSTLTPAGGRGGRHLVLDSVRRHVVAALPARRLADLQDHHARWAQRLARRADAGLRTHDHARWWTRLGEEHANLRAALTHCADGGDPAVGLALAGDLAWYWYRHGDVAEGRSWLSRMLTLAPGVDAALQGRAHLGLALLAYLDGDAAALDAQASAAMRTTGDDVVVARAAGLRALAAVGSGDDLAATALLAAVPHSPLPPWAQAEIDVVAGLVAAQLGQVEEALGRLEDARDRAGEVGHRWAEGSSAWFAAKILLELGRPGDAAATLRAVLHHFSGEGERTGPLAAVHTLATAVALQGRVRRAAVLVGGVDAWGERIGYHPLAMDPLHGPRHRELLESAVPHDILARGRAEGAALSFDGLLDIARQDAALGA